MSLRLNRRLRKQICDFIAFKQITYGCFFVAQEMMSSG